MCRPVSGFREDGVGADTQVRPYTGRGGVPEPTGSVQNTTFPGGAGRSPPPTVGTGAGRQRRGSAPARISGVDGGYQRLCRGRPMCRPVSGSREEIVSMRTHRSAPTRGGAAFRSQRDRCKTRPSPAGRGSVPARLSGIDGGCKGLCRGQPMCRPVSRPWEDDVSGRTHRSAPTRGGKRSEANGIGAKYGHPHPKSAKRPRGREPAGPLGSFFRDQPSALGASAAAFSAAALAAAAAFSA